MDPTRPLTPDELDELGDLRRDQETGDLTTANGQRLAELLALAGDVLIATAEANEAKVAKAAAQPDPPAEPGDTIELIAGGAHPHLLAKGYTAARAELVGSASRIQAAGMATIDEALGYAEESLGKAQVKDAPRQVVEGIGDELRILRACRHLCQELNKIAEGQAARQRILGGQ